MPAGCEGRRSTRHGARVTLHVPSLPSPHPGAVAPFHAPLAAGARRAAAFRTFSRAAHPVTPRPQPQSAYAHPPRGARTRARGVTRASCLIDGAQRFGPQLSGTLWRNFDGTPEGRLIAPPENYPEAYPQVLFPRRGLATLP
jgi:hypothetical protein